MPNFWLVFIEKDLYLKRGRKRGKVM